MTETDVECVVVGGGIAGLTAAYRLSQHSVLVLEASERLGGRVRSQSRGEYWVNLGAMFVAPEGPLAELAHLPGVDLNRLRGKAIMDIKGRKLRANSPVDLMVKAPISMSARSSLARFSLRLGRDYKRMNKKGPDGRTYTDQLDSRSAADVFAISRLIVRRTLQMRRRLAHAVQPDHGAEDAVIVVALPFHASAD